jgi:hypothetical protein
MATEFQKASKGKIVSDTPAMQEFERIREEASIEAAAARAGKSPEEIKAEAKAAGTDPISWIKDKYPPPEAQKKPADRAPAEPVADQIETPEEKATRLQKIQSQVKAGTYNSVGNLAASLGVPEEAAPKTVAETVKKAAKEKKKAEAAPLVQEAPTVAEQVKSGAALKKEQAAIRSAITSAPQFAIITAESPRGESVPGGNEALRKELEAKGYKFEQMEGMYGGKENPFLVQTDKLSDIQSLGKKYGQESVILADNNKYKMQFTSGPQEGQFYTANTITQHATPPKDYYSTVVRDGRPVHFTIDFNMKELKGKPVAQAKAPAQALAKVVGPEVPPPATAAENAAQAERREPLRKLQNLYLEAGQSANEAAKSAEKVVQHAETVAAKSKGSLENAVETLVKTASKNPKTSLAAALLGLATAGYQLSGKGASGDIPPETPATPPVVTPPEKKKESVEPPPTVVNTVAKGDDTLTEFEAYKKKMSLTDTEKEKFAGIEERLKDSLDSAKEAYSQGMRSTELYKAFEKIAEGLALYGAGLYGKKSGIDAVSGLKFSPIDWSTRTDRLTKELDMADKSYTKGMETVKEERRGIEKLREEAVKFEEGRKERDEKRAERLSTKEVATQEKGAKGQKDILDRKIKDLDRQINDIEKVRTSTPKSGDAMERQYNAVATTLGIPKEEYTTKVLGFRKSLADAAFLKKQQELVAQRSQLEKQLTGEAVASQPVSGLTPELEARRQELERKKAGK